MGDEVATRSLQTLPNRAGVARRIRSGRAGEAASAGEVGAATGMPRHRVGVAHRHRARVGGSAAAPPLSDLARPHVVGVSGRTAPGKSIDRDRAIADRDGEEQHWLATTSGRRWIRCATPIMVWLFVLTVFEEAVLLWFTIVIATIVGGLAGVIFCCFVEGTPRTSAAPTTPSDY
ncbi:hypothetical protein [Rhodococcus sovatensis]|uniref:DUF4395 domain-containing protein n=1 Tax=Rhodococcus sovatensis TaxID=1805840 RepID=A0ABZ2PTN9_9NOCA